MGSSWLKKLRIIFSLLFFFMIGALFIDFTGKLVSSVFHAILHLQFIPSVLNFYTTLAPATLGFLLILVLTLLFGRIYCSTLCPLGTMQDIFSYLSRKLKPGRAIYRYKRPLNWWRYGLTLLIIFSILAGTILLVNIFDPYSAFGKIFHNLVRPVVIFFNNVISKLLSLSGIYVIYPVKWVGVNKAALILAMFWSILLVVMAVKRGRLYCNTLCPVGTILGIFARYSLFRIRLDKSVCNSCGKCSVVCKAECIDPVNRKLDFDRCIGCMNCLSPCPEGGVKYVAAWKRKLPVAQTYSQSKREFIRESGLMLAGILTASKTVFSQNNKNKETIIATVPVIREFPVTPPGAVSQERYNSLCTACHLCVSACPTLVLQPAYFLYGLNGFLQPRMDYITNFCNFECTVCGEVCPTGAILPLAPEEKKLLQLGKVNFIKENCVVYTNNTDCGACSEHCPTKAVIMVPYTGKLTIPEIKPEICIGCGACEYACPTDPKSIYVEGNPVHLVAERPKEELLELEIDYQEDFPF